MGLRGNDSFEIDDGSSNDEQILLGGTGNDTYTISNDDLGFTMIYEAPNHGNDKIYLGSDYYNYGNFMSLEKKHLLASDGNHVLFIVDAFENKGIERINLGGFQYSSNYFLSNLSLFPGYLGNYTWNQLKPYIGDETLSIVRNSLSKVKSRVLEIEDLIADLSQSAISSSSLILDNNFRNLTHRDSYGIDSSGNSYENTLSGDSDDNKLNGGPGDDILVGGTGNDILTGGAGNDTFQINSGIGRDIITDYGAGNDQIKILGGLKENHLTINQAGSDVRIKYEDDLLAIVKIL